MAPYYYNSGQCGTYPTHWYTAATNASPTATPDWWFNCWYTIPVTKSVPLPPKNWRWFDTFREWEAFIAAIPTPYVVNNVRRVQERFPIQQRQQQKRRIAVQKIRAPITRRI